MSLLDLLEDPGDTKTVDRAWVRRRNDGKRGQVFLDPTLNLFRVRVELSPGVLGDPQPYDAMHWTEDYPERSLNPIHIQQICYVADDALRNCLGDYASRPEFARLSKEDRARWSQRGPDEGHEARQAMFLAIRKALRPFLSKG